MAERVRPGEFALIEQLFAPLAAGEAGAFGLLNDAASVDPPLGESLIVTTDVMVAGVHFPADEEPGAVGVKLLRVNLSDLAAMGASPIGYLLGLALPAETPLDWLEGFASGLAADQTHYRVGLLGGDTVSTPGPLTLSLTALGRVVTGAALTRSDARPGDRVYVSGTVGDGALGLATHRGELGALDAADQAHLLARFRRPEPRLALGCRLIGLASAAIDLSDGLVADLGHIAVASGVGATIEAAAVPLSAAARAAVALGAQRLNEALTGGDDYELAFTVPADSTGAISSLSAELTLKLTAIGWIEADPGVRVIDPGGAPMALGAGGYRHF